ncbi:cysteine-rich CWC family protein [Piscinibacter sp.]|uniref:cysteine-rich CWC family protein n=1 Tax=Piscinibacter sp. TaxID=1903157 RepID=UPI0039E5F5F6
MDTPPPGDNARCPRCGGAFRCGAADAGPCACGTLELTPELRAALAGRYRTCLCLACLRELAAGPPTAARVSCAPCTPASSA